MKYFNLNRILLLFVAFSAGCFLIVFSSCNEFVEKAKQLIPEPGEQYNAEKERQKSLGNFVSSAKQTIQDINNTYKNKSYKRGNISVTPLKLALFAEMSAFPFDLNPNEYKNEAAHLNFFPLDKNLQKKFKDFKKWVIDVDGTNSRNGEYISFSYETNEWAFYDDYSITIGKSDITIALYYKDDTVILAINGEEKYDFGNFLVEQSLSTISNMIDAFLGICDAFSNDEIGNLADVINNLFEKGGFFNGTKHVYITGYSMGGTLAIHSAGLINGIYSYDGRVDGVAIFNGMPVKGTVNIEGVDANSNEYVNYFMFDDQNDIKFSDICKFLGSGSTEAAKQAFNIPSPYYIGKMEECKYKKRWFSLDPDEKSIERFYQALAKKSAIH